MKFSAHKDNRKRQNYSHWEIFLLSSKALYLEYPQIPSFLRKELNKNKIKNRCVLTSRSKGVLSFFKLSRMSFKEKASFGHLAGIRRSSW